VILSRLTIALRAILFLCGGLLPALTANASQVPTPPTSHTVATHEVTDDVGRTVNVPVNPVRIVSLAPSLTEIVYALGAQDRLVGDTVYCDYPTEAQSKPKVGGVIDPNLESIAALHPDLVLVSKDGGNRLETVRALESFGIPAYATDTHKIAQILTLTEKLGALLNVPEAGKAIADDMRKRLAQIQARLTGVPPKNVLFVVWMEPLISVGKETFVADAIVRAGAVSIIDSSKDWPQVSMEEVAHLQPDFLVFAHSQGDIVGHNLESLVELPGWKLLDAVKAHHYAVISDAVIRPAPRIVSAIEDLAKQLHPEVFAEQRSSGKVSSAPNSAFLVKVAVADDCSFGSLHPMVVSCAR
jgi:iron complex transport system substrate-binding protein